MAKKDKSVLTKGRKKTSMARARIRRGAASVKINGKPLAIITPDLARRVIEEPLAVAAEIIGDKALAEMDIDVNVIGGGTMGQAFASRTAIGKALVEFTQSDELRKRFVDYDRTMLIDDVRLKEPKKYLRKGARAKPIKSYR